MPDTPLVESSRLGFLLRALRYRNYRLFFMGQIVSLLGTWITTTASSWLVFRLTGSPLLLGVVGFASQIPTFVLAPLAGVFVDRWDRRRLLILTQTLSMLQSFALAYLTLTGRINITWILTLNGLQGIVNAFDMPSRQSLVISMIENKEDLGNAIALNSSMVNASRLVGPAIAGSIIAASNEGWCFLVDGVSYLAVLAALAAMHVVQTNDPTQPDTSAMKQMLEGWRYVSHFVPIRSIILLLALVSLVGVPYGILIPVFAGPILHGGPHTLGWLMTASGSGALMGALWLASRRSVVGLGRIIPLMAALFGAGLIAFSFSRWLWLSLLILPLTGFGFMVQMAASNTIVQTIVDDVMRGRVMSFFMMAFLGTAPFGSLLAGGLADRIGAPHTLLLGGIGCILGGMWFARGLPALRKAVRPIYIQKGIIPEGVLPEIATAVQHATHAVVPPEN